MATLLVGYDLNRPGQNYPELFEALKACSRWWHHLDSTWLVVTNETHVELRDRLRRHIDASDELLVIDVSGDAAAWTGLSDKGGRWIKDNL
jgi:hypothetical protein